MGYALASSLIEAGAKVTLISGPVSLECPKRCQLISVVSADDMLQAALAAAKDADIFISAAAVADYRVVEIADQKIKKQDQHISLELQKNTDIVATVASTYKQLYVVGFAAETENIESFAKDKLQRKQLDAIVVNDVSRADIGFNADDNEVSWIDKHSCKALGKKSKTQLARDLVALIAAHCDD